MNRGSPIITADFQPKQTDPALSITCTISVIIPACDRIEFLREAIDSVLNQFSKPDEIIIVDNGKYELSPDTIPLAVKTLRIEPYSGVSRARNAGAKTATGEYLAFLDDDDMWAPDYLQHARHIIQQEKSDGIVATLSWMKENEISHISSLPEQITNGQILFGSYVSGSNIVIKKEAFMRAGGYDTDLSWGEDATLVADMLNQGARILPCSKMRTLYREHSGVRLSTSKTSEKIKCYYRRNAFRMTMRQHMYLRMRLTREMAREKRSLGNYLISKIYRVFHKILSLFH